MVLVAVCVSILVFVNCGKPFAKNEFESGIKTLLLMTNTRLDINFTKRYCSRGKQSFKLQLHSHERRKYLPKGYPKLPIISSENKCQCYALTYSNASKHQAKTDTSFVTGSARIVLFMINGLFSSILSYVTASRQA